MKKSMVTTLALLLVLGGREAQAAKVQNARKKTVTEKIKDTLDLGAREEKVQREAITRTKKTAVDMDQPLTQKYDYASKKDVTVDVKAGREGLRAKVTDSWQAVKGKVAGKFGRMEGKDKRIMKMDDGKNKTAAINDRQEIGRASCRERV